MPTTTINVRDLVALLQSTRCVCGHPKREGDERCDVCREGAKVSEHTPGPWIVRVFHDYGRKNDDLWVMDSMPDMGNNIVANAICKLSGSNPAKVANANVLAAAPELLEACKAALDNDIASAGEGGRNMDDSLREELRAAIAKAQGKP